MPLRPLGKPLRRWPAVRQAGVARKELRDDPRYGSVVVVIAVAVAVVYICTYKSRSARSCLALAMLT